MNTIEISQQSPRSLKELNNKISFSKGISKWLNFTVIISLLGIMAFVSSFFPPIEAGLIFFKIVVFITTSIISFFIYKTYKKNVKKRKLAFKNGKVIKAKVIRQGRTMSLYKSAFDYSVDIMVIIDNKKMVETIVSSNRNLYNYLPTNKEFDVLYDFSSEGLLVAELWGYQLKVI